MQRAGHAVLAGGGVWLIDPPDGQEVEAAVVELGTPAGVLQLLDRHPRDCAAIAQRLGVPHLRVPLDGAALPFEVLPQWHLPFWNEDALWLPEHRVLVVAEALVGAPDFAAPGETVGVHPARRLLPPGALGRLEPETLLMGHGPPLHGAAARAAIDDALHGARRRLPLLLGAQAVRAVRGRFR
ncbi:hypothetical protein C7Y72_22560 [Paraconexibacter algicola]|uniref:MBL fold metallo-hydrolase n=2 Tax=Paraconexibacter algicola TaxID=2133960 RepID=A0A2T4UBH5_9ACTN|nr:hypothetical protein C7Y72_22560 [Paraconexibacter algicola]